MQHDPMAGSKSKKPPARLVVTLAPLPTFCRRNQESFTAQEALEESRALLSLAVPIALTALLFYSRSVVSMLFLGYLGNLQLAAGSLAIAFANITAYSVLSGLALGMDPLCSQAFGANCQKLLSLILHRCVLFLLCS